MAFTKFRAKLRPCGGRGREGGGDNGSGSTFYLYTLLCMPFHCSFALISLINIKHGYPHNFG